MAMLKGRDYVIIKSYMCPRCKTVYARGNYKVGRSPHPSKLHCYRQCGIEFYPSADAEVVYED